ncbi:MAG: hypothetical protein LBS74_00905 [Oscillospiraceae bacterium]|jgi:Leucine-rich repeat (LRR) protein|nr:hypothetical protein [Oscillospiraceae bacterium]
MKKLISVLLVMVVCFGVAAGFAGCSFDLSGNVAFESAELESKIIELGIGKGYKTGIDQNKDGKLSKKELLALTALEIPHTGSSFSSLKGLEYAKNLTILDVAGGSVSDLSPLSELSSLKFLSITKNKISDVSPLSGLGSLNYLSLTTNQIADISPLSNLLSLEILIIDHNQISDVTPLAKLTSLKLLVIEANPIKDTSPLKKLPANCVVDIPV